MNTNSAGNYVIDIRDQRLRGERLTLSTRTKRGPEARKREAAVRALLGMGAIEVIERLRDRSDPLRIGDVARAHAANELDRLIEDAAAAVDPEPEPEPTPLLLGDVTADFLQRVKAERKSGTHTQYETVFKMAVEHFGEDKDLASIAPKEWRAWLNEDKETAGDEPWSHNRRVLVAALLSRMYSETIKDEDHRHHRTGEPPRITRNPFDRIDTPQWQRGTRAEHLRRPEWAHLFDTVEGTPEAAFLSVGSLAGLRLMEASNLRTGIDVVVDGHRPRLEIQPRGGEYEWGPKGYPRHEHSVRTIPLRRFPTLLAILRRHIELGYAGDNYFFHLAGYDRPISAQTLRDWTERSFEAAGIRYGRKKDALTYHNLRHTFISWLVQADYSLVKISKLAGTSVQMIIKVYGHLIDEDLDQGMALIESALQKGGRE